MSKRYPPNLFGVPFGLMGLGATWQLAADQHLVTPVVSDFMLAAAAAVWMVVATLYIGQVIRRPASILADLTDPVLAPFLSLAPIGAMMLAAVGLASHAPTVGRALFDVFAVATVALGGWFTGQWIYTDLAIDQLHPGYFLPTVAGGLLGAECAAKVGQPGVGRLLFGLGLVCWIILGSIILGRLLIRPRLTAPLTPTLAIEVAPAALASAAWFSLHGAHADAMAAGLGGYGLLMILAQIRLLPLYARLHFTPAFWSFTFPWAAVATLALTWLHIEHPAWHTALAVLVLSAITLLVGAIAVRTAIGLRQGTFLPSATTATEPSPSVKVLAASNGA